MAISVLFVGSQWISGSCRRSADFWLVILNTVNLWSSIWKYRFMILNIKIRRFFKTACKRWKVQLMVKYKKVPILYVLQIYRGVFEHKRIFNLFLTKIWKLLGFSRCDFFQRRNMESAGTKVIPIGIWHILSFDFATQHRISLPLLTGPFNFQKMGFRSQPSLGHDEWSRIGPSLAN